MDNLKHVAHVTTPQASKYIAQLCKHFAHKITVDFDDQQGRAEFPWGICHMHASPEVLTLACEAADAEGLERVKAVIADHLVRFSWREPVSVTWTEPAA